MGEEIQHDWVGHLADTIRNEGGTWTGARAYNTYRKTGRDCLESEAAENLLEVSKQCVGLLTPIPAGGTSAYTATPEDEVPRGHPVPWGVEATYDGVALVSGATLLVGLSLKATLHADGWDDVREKGSALLRQVEKGMGLSGGPRDYRMWRLSPKDDGATG